MKFIGKNGLFFVTSQNKLNLFDTSITTVLEFLNDLYKIPYNWYVANWAY